MSTAPTTPTKESPLLPPEPWYHSPVQVGAVIAAAAQIVSILVRWFGLPVTDEQIDGYTADASQLVAIVAGVFAIIKRKNSEIQPLTLTAGSAASKAHSAQLNPITMEKRNGGYSTPLFTVVMLALAIVMSFGLVGCETLGVPTPKSYSERVASGYSAVTTIRMSATTLLNGKLISSEDATNVQKMADTAREALDVSRSLTGVDAEHKVESALLILQAARTYLCTKNPSDPNCAGA